MIFILLDCFSLSPPQNIVIYSKIANITDANFQNYLRVAALRFPHLRGLALAIRDWLSSNAATIDARVKSIMALFILTLLWNDPIIGDINESLFTFTWMWKNRLVTQRRVSRRMAKAWLLLVAFMGIRSRTRPRTRGVWREQLFRLLSLIHSILEVLQWGSIQNLFKNQVFSAFWWLLHIQYFQLVNVVWRKAIFEGSCFFPAKTFWYTQRQQIKKVLRWANWCEIYFLFLLRT